MIGFNVCIFVSLLLQKVISLDVKIMPINDKDELYYGNYVNKTDVCNNIHFICKADNSKVCAMRFLNSTFEWKVFENTCYLFLNNLCEYFRNEFHIIEYKFCDDSTSIQQLSRRTQVNITFPETINNASNNNGSRDNATIDKEASSNATKFNKFNKLLLYKPLLRQKTTTKKRKYDIDDAFDDHPCPHSCPNVYSPVCMSVNRGEGKYFKFFTFYNHCQADIYYCIHYNELGPPPGREYEDVQVSPLSWSFCGAFRYLQFARYSEILSSMGHYGWLAGDYRYSYIMKPHQRLPGYGK